MKNVFVQVAVVAVVASASVAAGGKKSRQPDSASRSQNHKMRIRFEKLDQDGNCSIDAADFKHKSPRKKWAKKFNKLLNRYDKNKDRKISRVEFTGGGCSTKEAPVYKWPTANDVVDVIACTGGFCIVNVKVSIPNAPAMREYAVRIFNDAGTAQGNAVTQLSGVGDLFTAMNVPLGNGAKVKYGELKLHKVKLYYRDLPTGEWAEFPLTVQFYPHDSTEGMRPNARLQPTPDRRQLPIRRRRTGRSRK